MNRISAEEVLFGEQAENANNKLMVFSVYEDERPLKRAVGLIDWRLKGHLSKLLLSGWVKGSLGEITYVPVLRNEQVLHLLLIGLGAKSQENTLKPVLKNLKHTIENLKFKKAAISSSSFSETALKDIQNELSQIEIEWMT